jgi:hypothetical protein
MKRGALRNLDTTQIRKLSAFPLQLPPLSSPLCSIPGESKTKKSEGRRQWLREEENLTLTSFPTQVLPLRD